MHDHVNVYDKVKVQPRALYVDVGVVVVVDVDVILDVVGFFNLVAAPAAR